MPSISGQTPPGGTLLLQNAPISFTVLEISHPFVLRATFPDGQSEIVWDGAAFAPYYMGSSVAGSIVGTSQVFTILRKGGWPAKLGAATFDIPAGVAGLANSVSVKTPDLPSLKSAVDPGAGACFVAALDGSGGMFTWVSGDATAEDGGTVFASTYPSAPAGRWHRVYSGHLDAQWFGIVGDGVTDNLAKLQAIIAAIPVNQVQPVQVLLPPGRIYLSGNLRINRAVELIGRGAGLSAYASGSPCALLFPPLCGIIFDGYFSSQDYPGGRSDCSILRDVAVVCTQAVASDALGNWGRTMYQLDTSLDTWSGLPATVPLGTCVLRSGAPVGSPSGDYYGDGTTRSTVHLVMFRCTTSGTKGSAEPGAFATAGLGQLGTTINATGGTAVWTVESVPKDYQNSHTYVVGQRVFIPGDNDHVFECTIAGTSISASPGMNWSGWGIGARVNGNFVGPAHSATFYDAGSQIDTPSNGVVLPLVAGTLHVVDTTDLAASGTVQVWNGTAYTAITYTGKTGTTLTGCSGGTGTLATGYEVGQGCQWKHVIGGEGITLLGVQIRLDNVLVVGATGCGIWITANWKLTLSGGSYFHRLRNYIISSCGSGLTLNSNDCSGTATEHAQEYLLGAGHTNVDGAAYLNIPAGRWGNGGTAVKDRNQGTVIHEDHYLQFSGGIPYRNDLLGGVNTGNSTQWLKCSAESTFLSLLFGPAVVEACTMAMDPTSSSLQLHPTQSKNIVTQSPLHTNAAKYVSAVLGPQYTGGPAAPFTISHSDDSYPIGFSISDDWSARPAKWWVWGQQEVPSGWTGSVYMFPRMSSGALWPSGTAIGVESSSLPFWVTNDRIWIGYSPNTDPPSIGFGSAAPASGHYMIGSVVWNTAPGAGQPDGWRCTVSGSPGTWITMHNSSSLEITAPDFAPTGLTGATAASRIVGGTASGHPTSGTFAKGDSVTDQTGSFWICTAAGTPGTWVNIAPSSGGGGSSINAVAAAKVTTDFTTTSGAYVDVTGLSATFSTTGTSTIVAQLMGCVSIPAAVDVTFQILVDGTPVTSDGTHTAIHRLNNGASGSSSSPLSLAVELSGVAAGSHTVKVQVKTAGGTVNIRPGSGGTAFESAQLKCFWY